MHSVGVAKLLDAPADFPVALSARAVRTSRSAHRPASETRPVPADHAVRALFILAAVVIVRDVNEKDPERRNRDVCECSHQDFS